MVYFEIGLYMLLQLPFLYLIQKTALKNCSGNKKLRLWKLFIIRAFVPCSIPFTIGITHTLPLRAVQTQLTQVQKKAFTMPQNTVGILHLSYWVSG